MRIDPVSGLRLPMCPKRLMLRGPGGLLVALNLWLALLVAPALAEIVLREDRVLDTRFGRLQVTGGGISQGLAFNGAPLPMPASERYWIRAAFGLQDEAVDWVLVSSNHSGTLCGGLSAYHLLRVAADGVRVSPPIQACSRVDDLRLRPGAVELDLPHRDLTIERETFVFDGISLTSRLTPLSPAAPAGAGPDVTRWIGRSAAELLDDPSEQARFAAIMTPAQIQELAGAMSFGSPVEQRGDWVIAAACQRHACNSSMGAFGIRISDGAAAAAILTGDRSGITGQRSYGLAADPTFASALQRFYR